MQVRNRFVEGPFAPVTEEVTAFELSVTGSIPVELDGCYLRNGPNPLRKDDPNYHWFIGAGMLHGVRLRDGRAEWYRNRWVRSQAVAAALGEPWPGGPVHAGMDTAPNTHVIAHAGRILATVESGPLPYELTTELDTIGPCDFAGTLTAGFAAHTKYDSVADELHAVAYFWASDQVQHVVVGTDGRVASTTDIAVTDHPMMHDFAITEQYVVLLDLPVTFSMDAVAAGSEMPYTWNDSHQARVGLLPRAGGEVRWIDIEPCFVFHTLNAYDAAGRVVLDVCRYERAYDVSQLRGPGHVRLERWLIDPLRGTVAASILDDRQQEFPRIDERRLGRQHRYGYSAASAEGTRATLSPDPERVTADSRNAVFKHDLVRGAVEAHEFGDGAVPGEFVFVPSSSHGAEDDGYLIGFAHDPERDAADLVILAAQDISGAPVARVHLPARVPLGFHGNWMAHR